MAEVAFTQAAAVVEALDILAEATDLPLVVMVLLAVVAPLVVVVVLPVLLQDHPQLRTYQAVHDET